MRYLLNFHYIKVTKLFDSIENYRLGGEIEIDEMTTRPFSRFVVSLKDFCYLLRAEIVERVIVRGHPVYNWMSSVGE